MINTASFSEAQICRGNNELMVSYVILLWILNQQYWPNCPVRPLSWALICNVHAIESNTEQSYHKIVASQLFISILGKLCCSRRGMMFTDANWPRGHETVIPNYQVYSRNKPQWNLNQNTHTIDKQIWEFHEWNISLFDQTSILDRKYANKITLLSLTYMAMRYGWTLSGLILGLRPANERWCYFVMTSLIGWAQT